MSPTPVSLIPLQCIRCQQPIPAQPDEVVWVCQNCGQGLVLSASQGLQPQVVHFSNAIPDKGTGKPVWVATGQAAIQRETFSGNESREMQEFWAGPRPFFIPAYSLDLDQLAKSGVQLLRQPPMLQETPTPAAFLPVTIHPEDIQPLAEYILLAVEAERRDQLRSISFTLQLGQPELWIFP